MLESKQVRLDPAYGLHPMHPALGDIASLRERVQALESELGRPFVVERGPWTASADGRQLESDDFTHDVLLTVRGDFSSGAQRKTYADELARRLNLVLLNTDVGCPNIADSVRLLLPQVLQIIRYLGDFARTVPSGSKSLDYLHALVIELQEAITTQGLLPQVKPTLQRVAQLDNSSVGSASCADQ